MRFIGSAAIALLLLVLGPVARAQPPPERWSILRDAPIELTVGDVSGRLASEFRPLGSGNASYTRDAVWLRLDLPSRGEPEEGIIDVGRAWLEDVRFYAYVGGRPLAEARSGEAVPFSERPIPNERAAYRLLIPAGEAATVFVRISGDAPIAVEPQWLDAATFDAHAGAEHLWFGCFLGIVTTIALYQLVLYRAMRDVRNLLLGGALLAYALGEGCAHGIVGRFVPALGPLLPRLTLAAFATVGALLTRLTVSLLAIKGAALVRALTVLVLAQLAVVAIALAVPRAGALVFGVQAVSLAFDLVAGLSRIRSLGSTARLYVVAVTSFVVPATLPVLEILGAIPLRAWTENGAHVGALLLSVLLSLSVADRMARLHEGALRFVPWPFLEELGRHDLSQVELGDSVEATMTVLFADIRSFTSRSEQMTARQTFDFLNTFLGHVVPSIRNEGGFVDKYIGDAIMALFPRRPDDALRACIAMQRATEDAYAVGEGAVSLGIGVHTGPMMLGIIGEPKRIEATVISDAVNLASRLETLTKHYGARVLVSAEVVACLERPDDFRFRRLGSARVKGREASVEILELLDAEPHDVREIRLATLDDFHRAIDALERGKSDASKEFARRVIDRDPSDAPARVVHAQGGEERSRKVPANDS